MHLSVFESGDLTLKYLGGNLKVHGDVRPSEEEPVKKSSPSPLPALPVGGDCVRLLIGDSSAGRFTSIPPSPAAPRPCEIGSDLHSVVAPSPRLSFAFQGAMNNLRTHDSQISSSEHRTYSPSQHDRPQ